MSLQSFVNAYTVAMTPFNVFLASPEVREIAKYELYGFHLHRVVTRCMLGEMRTVNDGLKISNNNWLLFLRNWRALMVGCVTVNSMCNDDIVSVAQQHNIQR